MFKRIFRLFQIARKLSTSGAIILLIKFTKYRYQLIYFLILYLLDQIQIDLDNKKTREKLCIALQGMGTTFIKLGQFLATRPDIIGEEMAKDLEKLQDKVPAFDLYRSKKNNKKRNW